MVGLLVAATACFALASAGSAGATTRSFTLNFQESSIKSSLLSEIPLESLSATSSIEGTIDETGVVRVPKDKFLLPVLDVSSIGQSLTGIEVPVEIRGYMGVEEAAEGAFDPATGKLEIETKAGIWLSVNVPQLLEALGGLGINLGELTGGLPIGAIGNLTCGFAPMDVKFTTESTSLGSGRRFTEGLSGTGSLIGQWSQLGPLSGRGSIPIFGGLNLPASTICRALPPLIGDAIGGALGESNPGLAGIDLDALLSNLDQLDLGPSSLTLIRTLNEPAARVPEKVLRPPAKVLRVPAELALKVTPKKVTSRPGKRLRYRARIRNVGPGTARRVKLCAIAAKRSFRGKRCKKLGRIRPGEAKRRSFKLKLSRSARKRPYRVRFVAKSASGRSDRQRVRVKVR